MITVLCVEDEQELRKLLVEEFQDAGLATIEASNGKEGLDVMLSSWPDIVVCDISMPVMNGHELLAEIQINHPELSNTPFIMLTALSDKENQIAGLSAGAEDYLTKPVDLELLMAKINGCIMRLQNNRRTGHGL
ncbi:response regulator transcription factor [Agrobacterium pusense]|uniref:response regulator transcription factor n=1 Tax=Agrobacterium pusense TaxID=648995 RepID=UPI003FCF0ABC